MPSDQTATKQAGPRRIEWLDVARGAALIAMAVYHFTWDLEFFGYVLPGTTGFGAWKLFARCIASSFLFLVGISLVLAGRGHGGLGTIHFGRRHFRLARKFGSANIFPTGQNFWT